MIVTYDIEVLRHDWIMVFKEGEDYRVIHNNREEFANWISKQKQK